MRFLKQRNLSRRIPNDTTLYSDVTNSNVYVSPTGRGSLVLPTGPTSNQPASPVAGMMRYDTTLNQVMVYQGSSWRALRFKESTTITQQNLGAGDASTVYFGPLNPAPPTTVQSGTTWGGQNILVIVENVIQLNGTNYTVVQNPTIANETYAGHTNGAVTSGSTTINFDATTGTSGITIYPSVDITGATVTGSVYLQGSTTVLSYTTDPTTDALTSIVISKPTITGTIANGTTLTITEGNRTGSGYYLYFSSPVPYGKTVTALIGFDQ
jgi:hypothetical protein